MCMWSLSYNSKLSKPLLCVWNFKQSIFPISFEFIFLKHIKSSLLALKILGKILLLLPLLEILKYTNTYLYILFICFFFVELLSNPLQLLVALNMYLQQILTHLVRQNEFAFDNSKFMMDSFRYWYFVENLCKCA